MTSAVVAWLLTLTGLVIAGTSIPLWLGKVPMNRWYGVRLQGSFESDEAWYRINRAGGKAGAVCGALIALVGVYCFVSPPESERVRVLLVMLTPLLLLPMVIVSAWAARQR